MYYSFLVSSGKSAWQMILLSTSIESPWVRDSWMNHHSILHCKCLHPECNQGCKFWVQQILFAIFAIDIWNCCNYLLLQFYDAKIHASICRVCKLKLHIWLQKLAAIIDCNNCIQSATGHVTLVKVAVLATQTFTVYSPWLKF